MDTTQSTQYDPQAVAMVRAIKMQESDNDYKAPKETAGQSLGGAYQYQAPTWKLYAKEVLGNENADFTPENQDRVTYGMVKKWKDSGLQPGDIAHNWNPHDPQYPEQVVNHLKQIVSKQGKGFNPKPYSSNSQGKVNTENNDTQEEGLGQQLINRTNDVGTAISNTASGKINPISGILQSVGGIAGGINDIAQKGLELIPGVKSIEGIIGKGVGALANTGIGKSITGGIGEFSKNHPELSSDIGALGNIAGTAGLVSGAGALKNIAGEGIAKVLGKDVLESAISDVAPEVGAKVGAKNIAKQGLIKTAIRGEIKPVIDTATKELGQVITDNVPGFNKLSTFADKVNATRETVYNMADKLKQAVISSGKDIIYPFQELSSAMDELTPGIAIKSDTVLNNQFSLAKQAALDIAKKEGGTISSLFDARKAFDELVREQFPTLYERANAPMRDAISKVRGTMNDFIESHLPEGSGFKDSLRTQSKLFNAIENMSPKAYKEIGTTRFSRFAGKHPVTSGLLKKGAQAIGTGLGAGAAYSGYRSLTD